MATSTIEKICPHCGKFFELTFKNGTRQRDHCSRSCAVKSTLERRVGAAEWTKEENIELLSLVGEFQRLQIISTWNEIAKEKGFPERSGESVKIQLDRLARRYGFKRKAVMDNWTLRELSRQLDLQSDRVERWIELGLEAQKIGSYARLLAITQKALKTFAVNRPEEMWGIDPKKLGKTIGDLKLAREICEIAGQPTQGRAITVIRLDTGDVYRSARSAACVLAPNGWGAMKSTILATCKRDTPMRNGMDWARIDYPVYWVPLAFRDEFNQVAGRLLYQIHGELKEVSGYQKTSCIIVAGRLAVQITLIIFRRRFKDSTLGVESRSIPELADFWRERFLGYINKYTGLGAVKGWNLLLSRIKSASYRYMAYLTRESDHLTLAQHAEDFAVHFINDGIRYFQQKSYVPYNYKPQTILEVADLYAYIEGGFWAQIELGKGAKHPLGHVKMIAYYRKYLRSSPREFDESYMSQSLPNSMEYKETLGSLLDFIKAHAPACLFQKYKLYIDLKIEECSDSEIASIMGLLPGKLIELRERLNQYARDFLGEAGSL